MLPEIVSFDCRQPQATPGSSLWILVCLDVSSAGEFVKLANGVLTRSYNTGVDYYFHQLQPGNIEKAKASTGYSCAEQS